ncbi:MAG: hypothetical protein H0T42_18990 [Deltaproteobacteria bacterium]|nr:hypothetical protein [Deltaproteobacteria bacterium]
MFAGTGMYLMFMRPAMLPEDAAFTNIELGTLPPKLSAWLSIVFATWGGFVTGFGVVLVSAAISLMTSQPRWLCVGTAAGILIAASRFLISNLILESDFLWFVTVIAALSALAATLLIASSRSTRFRDP